MFLLILTWYTFIMEKMKKEKTENYLEKQEKINVLNFIDLTVGDTAKLQKQISEAEDISYISKDILESATFDTTFHWPEKLPKGFSPEKLIEEGKNPGLGIRKLHEQGITGKEIIVGIIDQRISSTHSEFKDNIINNKEYYEPETLKKDTEVSMHGPGVVSLFVGKSCGVAPDAKVFDGAVNASKDGFLGFTKALKDVIEYNKNNEQKIKIVSVSKGHGDKEIPGTEEWIETKKLAKDSGITVIDSNYFSDNVITGGGSKTNKDKFDDYELPLFYDDFQRNKPSLEDVKNKLSSVNKDIQKKFFGKYKSEQNYIDTFNSNYLIVPSDYRSAASRQGDNEYRYEARGGWSWAIPYFAGVFALALQVNPDLTNDEFLEIAKKTAGTTKKGLKVINPEGIIKEVKSMVSENK